MIEKKASYAIFIPIIIFVVATFVFKLIGEPVYESEGYYLYYNIYGFLIFFIGLFLMCILFILFNDGEDEIGFFDVLKSQIPGLIICYLGYTLLSQVKEQYSISIINIESLYQYITIAGFIGGIVCWFISYPKFALKNLAWLLISVFAVLVFMSMFLPPEYKFVEYIAYGAMILSFFFTANNMIKNI